VKCSIKDCTGECQGRMRDTSQFPAYQANGELTADGWRLTAPPTDSRF